MDASIWQTKVNRMGEISNTSESKKEKLQEQITLNPGTLKLFSNQGCTPLCTLLFASAKSKTLYFFN